MRDRLLQEFFTHRVLRREDEYEVYYPRVIDSSTRRCLVLFTGTQYDACNFMHRHEDKLKLRVRPTGEKITR